MCDDSVNAFRRGVVLHFVVRAIGFKECTVDEAIFGVTKCIFGCVAQFLFDASCFVKTCGDESIVVGERLHDVLHIGVAFQELDGEETGGKLVAQGFVLLEEMFDAVDALLQTARVVDVDVDYTGFRIPDEFVVGYGLDYDQKYRNLPYIGVVKFD